MMAGLLLARQGVEVIVLEKHADFLRDFRGDTIHPSTQELIHELGWLDEFHRLPHSRMAQVTVAVGTEKVTFAEFGKLKVAAPYIAFLPQWDFLEFLHRKAAELPTFRLLRRTEATELMVEAGRVIGVHATSDDGPLEIRADLVIAADGRNSVLRARSGLALQVSSAPVDVLWFRLTRHPDERMEFFRAGPGGALVAIDRGDYWQVAYTIPAGSFQDLQATGLAELRRRVGVLAPALADRLAELDTWDDVHHLPVRVDRLRTWHRSGLLFIGDAAHAMSPAGGVGINLAIQDAVATANLLGPKLRDGSLTDRDLARVQRRRSLPARITQAFQLKMLRGLYPQDLHDDVRTHMPVVFRAFQSIPLLRRLAGRVIGLGIRPEHLSTQARLSSAKAQSRVVDE